MIIDTHCHLNDKSYDADLSQTLQNARNLGVAGFIIPGADINDLPKAAKIANQNEDVYFAVGVHPYDIAGFDERILRKFAADPKCVAVGECGLDYFRLPKDEGERQREDTFNILKEYADKLTAGAVLHCYNASPLLLELTKLGEFYFGIGGVLTFKNAKNLVQILPKIPLDRILIETDAPYLTPEPNRGKRNEPAFTIFVAKKIAEILSLSQREVCELTSGNAKRLFKCFDTE